MDGEPRFRRGGSYTQVLDSQFQRPFLDRFTFCNFIKLRGLGNTARKPLIHG